MTWTQPYQNLYLYVSTGIETSGNIAAFDLDWTLIRPVHGKFPKSPEDFAILPNRIDTLKDLSWKGFTIVIFTNQKSTNATKVQFNLDRVSNVIKLLQENKIPVIVFMSTKDDQFRKPQTGMWDVFTQMIKIKTAFYCGDAAGRPQDFSDSDAMFAKNIGIEFLNPEDVFPRVERIDNQISLSKDEINTIELPAEKSMVILMGMPGSGKSSYHQNTLFKLGYQHVSRDLLKTIPKMTKQVTQLAINNQLITVDATHTQQKDRQLYYNIAEKYKYSVVLLYFVGNGDGFNKLREKPGSNVTKSSGSGTSHQVFSGSGTSYQVFSGSGTSYQVPPVAYGVYYKYLEEPTPENTPGKLYQIS